MAKPRLIVERASFLCVNCEAKEYPAENDIEMRPMMAGPKVIGRELVHFTLCVPCRKGTRWER